MPTTLATMAPSRHSSWAVVMGTKWVTSQGSRLRQEKAEKNSTIVTPFFGRYADKHSFSRMVIVGFVIVGVSFLVNIFTVPANGKIFYTIHHCLYALAMGSIGTGMSNLIYDQVKGDARRDALAISSSLSGVAGFVTTCLMSPVVALIQKNGNRLLGISMYPAQFVSAIAFVLTLLLVLYVYFFVIRAGQKDTPDKN